MYQASRKFSFVVVNEKANGTGTRIQERSARGSCICHQALMEKMTPHFKVAFKNVLKAHGLSSKIQVLNIFVDLCACRSLSTICSGADRCQHLLLGEVSASFQAHCQFL